MTNTEQAVFRFVDLDRKRIIDAFASRFEQPSGRPLSLQRMAPLQPQHFRCLWDVAGLRTDDLPHLIAVIDDDFRDSLAYLTTYGPLSPLTPEIPLLAVTELTRMGDRPIEYESWLIAALAGAAIGESVGTDGVTERLDDVALGDIEGTFSFCAAQLILRGRFGELENLVDRWEAVSVAVGVDKRQSASMFSYQLNALISSTETFRDTLFVNTGALEALLSVIRKSTNDQDLWESVRRVVPDVALDRDFALLPRESRVSALRAIYEVVDRGPIRPELRDLIIAIAVAVALGGSLNALLAAQTFRTASLRGVVGWLGIVVGLMNRREALYDAGALLLKVSRSMAAAAETAVRYGAIQFDEFMALNRREGQSLQRHGEMFVQFYPGVVGRFKRATRPGRRKNVEASDIARRLRSLLDQFEGEVQRLERS